MLSSSKTVGKIRSKKAVSINRSRKPLQVLQPSAKDETNLVSSPKMVLKRESCSRVSGTKSFTILEDNMEIKRDENNLVAKTKVPEPKTGLRRSARKNSSNQSRGEVVVGPSLKQSRRPRGKKLPAVQEVAANNSSLNQSTLDGFFSATPKPSDTSKNATDLHTTANSNERSTQSVDSVDSPDHTSTIPPDQSSEEYIYYQKLAEEERIVLEKALLENAHLYDQLEVLQAENFKLREIVEECKLLAEIVNGELESI